MDAYSLWLKLSQNKVALKLIIHHRSRTMAKLVVIGFDLAKSFKLKSVFN